MNRYKLIALNCTAKNNRVLLKVDNKTYLETAWEEGRAEKLVKQKFLVRVEEKETNPLNVELKEVEIEESATVKEEIPVYEEITASMLKANLRVRGIDFKSNDSKKALYKKLYGVDA